MLVKVIRLYRAGKPRPDREVSADRGIVGEFTSCMVEGVAVAAVFDPASHGARTRLLPELYRAKLMSAHGQRMLLRGFENGSEPIPQEWSILVVALP